jgi:hypothetical protein
MSVELKELLDVFQNDNDKNSIIQQIRQNFQI